ncbi:hypothetical protein D3C87_1829100 [compost metagenome]
MLAGMLVCTSGSSTKSTPAASEIVSRICTMGCALKFSVTGLRSASAKRGLTD